MERPKRQAPRSARPQARIAELERENARLTRDLTEALERQKATGEILRIIRRFHTEVQGSTFTFTLPLGGGA